MSLGAALALIVTGVVSLAISEAIGRRGTVAEVYGGRRLAPFWRVLMLAFGVVLVGIGLANALG